MQKKDTAKEGGTKLILTGIAVFLARLIDVSCGTLKLKAIMRGDKMQAFIIAFIEVTIYMLAVSSGLKYISNPVVLILYSLGYATGNYLGILIDEKISSGSFYVLAVTDLNEETIALADYLRKKGYGVTTQKGWGLNGSEKLQIKTIINKRQLEEFKNILSERLKDAQVFLSIMEVREARSLQQSSVSK